MPFKRKTNFRAKKRAKLAGKIVEQTLSKAGVEYFLNKKPYKGGSTVSKGPFHNYGLNDPIKPYMMCRFTYSQNCVLSVGAFGVYGTEQVMNLNSCHDCDFSGGGHQPYGWDQMKTLYRSYKVYGALIEILASTPTVQGIIMGCTLQPSSETATITGKSNDAIWEQSNSVVRVLSNQGTSVTKIKQFVRCNQVEGVSKIQYNADDMYGAAVTTDPQLSPKLRIALADPLNGSTGACNVRIRITYFTKLYNRITQAQS